MVMGQASQHNYSAHMSTSLALGFLFMSGGSSTFSTSPEATAALVISLFPRFPHSPTDHRCHLQVQLLCKLATLSTLHIHTPCTTQHVKQGMCYTIHHIQRIIHSKKKITSASLDNKSDHARHDRQCSWSNQVQAVCDVLINPAMNPLHAALSSIQHITQQISHSMQHTAHNT